MTELPLVRAPRIPVTDTFHGVDVTEDYRWLEDASADETVAWTRAQQDRSATYFGEVGWRTTLRARVEQQSRPLLSSRSLTPVLGEVEVARLLAEVEPTDYRYLRVEGG